MRKLITLLLAVTLVCSASVVAFADELTGGSDSALTVVDEFDRNRIDSSPDISGGMVDDTVPPEESEDSEASEGIPEDEKLSLDEAEKNLFREQNTSLLDTAIFAAGIFCFMVDLAYVSLYTIYKALPSLGSTILRIVTLNRKSEFEEGIGVFLLKILAITVLGTLFTTGYFKLIILRLYGRVLQLF